MDAEGYELQKPRRNKNSKFLEEIEAYACARVAPVVNWIFLTTQGLGLLFESR